MRLWNDERIFIAKNLRDSHYEFKRIEEIDFLSEHTLVVNQKENERPWYLNIATLIFLDIIMFGWIQRVLFI